MSTVRKKRCRGFDLPPENVSEVEAHRVRFEAELDKYHANQGPNSQIFTKEKLAKIITTMHNYEQMTWPVIYTFCFCLKCRGFTIANSETSFVIGEENIRGIQMEPEVLRR